MNYVYLMVVEPLTDADAQHLLELTRKYGRLVANRPGCMSFHVDIEADGGMIVLTSIWQSREALSAYTSSKLYRGLWAMTRHLLISSFVERTFRRAADIRPLKIEVL